MIDIGTNSVLLLIAEPDEQGLPVALHEEERITRLGERSDQTGKIAGPAADRTIAALRDYRRRCNDCGVVSVEAVGTSVLREASNAAGFLRRASEVLDSAVRVIGGEEEAGLGFLAVASAFAGGGERIVLIDVGGGSTECVVGSLGRVESVRSLRIGSVRLTERHVRADPPRAEEIRAVRDEAEGAFGALPDEVEGFSLFGSAGTVTTLSALIQKLETYDPLRIHGHRIVRKDLDRLVDDLSCLSTAERRRLPGLAPERADVIVAGGVIVAAAMRRFVAPSIVVSHWGLRQGVWIERFGQGPSPRGGRAT